MKLTSKQKIDLETIRYFIPNQMKDIHILESDIVKFFEYSDKWMHKWEISRSDRSYFKALIEWKRWRGIHIWMYEEWIMDGSVPYIEILSGIPESVKNYLKKEMFQWIYSEKIDYIYNNLKNE